MMLFSMILFSCNVVIYALCRRGAFTLLLLRCKSSHLIHELSLLQLMLKLNTLTLLLSLFLLKLVLACFFASLFCLFCSFMAAWSLL